MKENRIISASNFVSLIKDNKKISESIVPELIRKLIRQTINSNTYTHFPSGDDIFTPGLDGIINENVIEHRFLPKGNILFEIGVKKDSKAAKSKIEGDYLKRKNEKIEIKQSEYTYIAITTAILNSTVKQELSDRYNNEKIFKKVVILDANDITDWLDDHINIGIWLLKQYGKQIDDYDITLLDDEWHRIALCTEPNLTTSLILIDNESNSDKLISDMISIKNNRIITISSQYYGRDFAFYFCVASLLHSNDFDIKERVLIVNSQTAFNYVNAFCSGKIVLVNFNCSDDRFVSCLNNTYIFFDGFYSYDMKLGLIKPDNFKTEVEKLGFSPDKAYRITFFVDSNVIALRRLLAKVPSIKIPAWSKNANKSELIPLLLMGEIKMDDDGDIEFLKSIIGDDVDAYTEKLNIWSEMDESPIFKFENIYRICSRRECFDYLQIDIFSSKLKSIETQLLNSLSIANNRYKKNEKQRFINDESYKWRDKLIENIINGFIILSEKKKNNQLHFDNLIERILDNIKGKYELCLTTAHFFYKFSELSPRAFLSFLRNSLIQDKDNFMKFINTNTSNYFVSGTFVDYIIDSLGYPLKIKDYSVESFELLLNLYYLMDDANGLVEKLLNVLSPVYTMEGFIALSQSEKINFFFKYSIGKDENKTKIIVKQLYGDLNNSVIIPVRNTFRDNIQLKTPVTYDEFLETRSIAFNWLMEHDVNQNEKIILLRNLVTSIHNMPFEKVKEQIESFVESNKSDSDENKSNYIVEILTVRENIKQYSDWKNLEIYLPIFDNAIKCLTPKDVFYQYRYMFINDDFPLYNPPSFDDQDWNKKSYELRDFQRREKLSILVKEYGYYVIKRIINECEINSYSIWPIIFDFSEDHFSDIKIMIGRGLDCGLRYYFKVMPFNEVKTIIQNYNNLDILIKNLPYEKDFFDFVNGKTYEKVYWENHNFDYRNKDYFEFLFEKFLKFAPYKLLSPFAYYIDCDYQHGIEILKSIANLSDEEKKNKIHSYELNSLEKLVRKLDKKFYTSELSLCEFNLLYLLKTGITDYPIGIKKYFWDNPHDLGKLLIQLFKQRNYLKSETMGYQILFEAYCSLSGGCYIPREYITEQREKLKKWTDDVLQQAKDENEDVVRLVKSAIINTLACCPKNISESVWPIIEVADILEELSITDYDDKFRVSSNFYCGYFNRRGVRIVEDGTAEFQLSSEFKKYQDYYRVSHPVTCRALEYISDNYKHEGEIDKIHAYLGLDY